MIWQMGFSLSGGAGTFQCKSENEMANGFHLCSFHLFKGRLGLFSASRRARNDMTNVMHLCFNDQVHHDRYNDTGLRDPVSPNEGVPTEKMM